MQLRTARSALVLLIVLSPFSLRSQTPTLAPGFYVFLVQGVSSDLPSGVANQATLVGSFLADGAGTITRGVADFNSPSSTQLNIQITGTYTTTSTNQIVLKLESGLGVQTLVIPPPPDHLYGVPITSRYMTSVNPGAIAGSGTLTEQNAATFSPGHLLGAYTSLIRGESACQADCLLAGSHARIITGSGTLTISSPTATYSTDFRESVGMSFRNEASSGPILPEAPPSFPFGRMTLQPTSAKQGSSARSFVAYIVDDTHLVFMSTDPHSKADLLSGTAFEPGPGLSPSIVRQDLLKP